MQRLPKLRPTTDSGYVYVAQSGERFKIGFSRTKHNVRRRVRDCGGVLVLTIRTGQQPAQLEYFINHRFANKRLPPQGDRAGDQREWFKLDESDLAWLRSLSAFLDHNLLCRPIDATLDKFSGQ